MRFQTSKIDLPQKGTNRLMPLAVLDLYFELLDLLVAKLIAASANGDEEEQIRH